MSLNDISTRDLVKELEKREGVRFEQVKPYEDYNLNVNGPAVVLVVTD